MVRPKNDEFALTNHGAALSLASGLVREIQIVFRCSAETHIRQTQGS
jgi:hypothetical protein